MTAATSVEPIVSLRGAAFGYADNAVVRHDDVTEAPP